MDYLLPTAMETPRWKLDNSPHRPLGAKGAGESATVGVPPDIANAVVDALSHLGVMHIDIPITPREGVEDPARKRRGGVARGGSDALHGVAPDTKPPAVDHRGRLRLSGCAGNAGAEQLAGKVLGTRWLLLEGRCRAHEPRRVCGRGAPAPPPGHTLDRSYLQGGHVGNRCRIALDVILWVFALFLAWVFARQGIAKFSDDSGWARAFRAWQFPVWFRLCIGVAETAAALLLLTRRTAFAGAAIIVAVMLGAMGTHVWWGQPGQVTSEILPLLLATVVAIGRRKSFLLRQRRDTPP
jgi:uncharacterized membrane protein YphA (DoxX/SURF4 family)